jgi:anti-anti-sigma factor
MEIITTASGDSTTLAINGRIDTNTSPKLQEEITTALQSSSNLTLDFAGVDYISSAGLRALLIGQKTAAAKSGIMEIVHVNDTVLSIFDMVGFSKILTIK